MTTRDYYKHLYVNKMDILEELGKYFEKCNLPRANQKEIENVNSTITSTKMENIIKIF